MDRQATINLIFINFCESVITFNDARKIVSRINYHVKNGMRYLNYQSHMYHMAYLLATNKSTRRQFKE